MGGCCEHPFSVAWTDVFFAYLWPGGAEAVRGKDPIVCHKIVTPSSQQMDDDGCLYDNLCISETNSCPLTLVLGKSMLHFFLGSRNLTGVSCELFV